MQDIQVRKIHTQVGYRAIHLNGWFKGAESLVGCEVQIRTELQDMWAAISYLDLYKRDDIATVTSRATSLANQLEDIDAEMQAVREEASGRPEYSPATTIIDPSESDVAC